MIDDLEEEKLKKIDHSSIEYSILSDSMTSPSSSPHFHEMIVSSFSSSERELSSLESESETASLGGESNEKPSNNKQQQPSQKQSRKSLKTIVAVQPRKRYKLPGCPRIFKDDLLRQYLFMFTNIMNSYDYPLIDSFVRKFSQPNLIFYKEPLQFYHDPFELKGMELFIYYLGCYDQISADRVFKIENVKMRQRVDSPFIELFGDFSINAMKYYNVYPDDLATSLLTQFPQLSIHENESRSSEEDSNAAGKKDNDKKKKKNSCGCKKTKCQLAKQLQIEDYQGLEKYRDCFYNDEDYQEKLYQFDPLNPEGICTQFGWLCEPVPMIMNGVLSILINEQRRIEKISWKRKPSGSPSMVPKLRCGEVGMVM